MVAATRAAARAPGAAATRAPGRAAARFVQTRLRSSGKVLSEEKKAAENVYIKGWTSDSDDSDKFELHNDGEAQPSSAPATRNFDAPGPSILAEMKQFAKSDTSVLKQHYETKSHEMEQEKRALQKENADLRHALEIGKFSHKRKDNYLQKLNMLGTQVFQFKKKYEAHQQLLRQIQKRDDAADRLQIEIQGIKSQKVQLQQKIIQESEQFRSWKAEMHKLLALKQKQKMVLQRKTEEAMMAMKRLKDLLEAKKSTRDTHGTCASGIQDLMRTIDVELEVTVRAYELRSHYDRQIQERATISKEIAKLKECPEAMSTSARSSRISALENMLSSSSSAMVSMASQLSEAEERECVFSGRGRWNHVRSLPDAKNRMNYLFKLASSSRCQLHDKDLIIGELKEKVVASRCQLHDKDLIIGELKEKVVALNGRTRQLEAQVNDLHNQNMQEKGMRVLAPARLRKNAAMEDNHHG